MVDSSNRNFYENGLNFSQFFKVMLKFKNLSKVATELKAANPKELRVFRPLRAHCIRPYYWYCRALPEDKVEAVRSVRTKPALHSWRLATSGAATEKWNTPGEKFAERHRSAALIAIFIPSLIALCPRERASSRRVRVEWKGGGGRGWQVEACE